MHGSQAWFDRVRTRLPGRRAVVGIDRAGRRTSRSDGRGATCGTLRRRRAFRADREQAGIDPVRPPLAGTHQQPCTRASTAWERRSSTGSGSTSAVSTSAIRGSVAHPNAAPRRAGRHGCHPHPNGCSAGRTAAFGPRAARRNLREPWRSDLACVRHVCRRSQGPRARQASATACSGIPCPVVCWPASAGRRCDPRLCPDAPIARARSRRDGSHATARGRPRRRHRSGEDLLGPPANNGGNARSPSGRRVVLCAAPIRRRGTTARPPRDCAWSRRVHLQAAGQPGFGGPTSAGTTTS